MDNKNFISTLAKESDLSTADIRSLLEATSAALLNLTQQDNSVAIPGFGTFAPEKHPEHIDEKDGRKTLYPPEIILTFTPSIVLRKKLAGV